MELPTSAVNASTASYNETFAASAADGPNYLKLLLVIPGAVLVFVCSLVCYAIFRVKTLRTNPSNVLFANSALADLLRGVMCFVNIWFYYRYPTYNSLNRNLCVAYLCAHVFQTTWSAWAMTALVYDRYDAMTRPFEKRITGRQVTIVSVVIVVFAAVLAAIPFTGWSAYALTPRPPQKATGVCSFGAPEENLGDAVFLPVYDFFSFALPFVCVCVFYSKIVALAARLAKQRRERRRIAGSFDSVAVAVASGEREKKETEWDRARASVRSRAFKVVTGIVVTNLLLTLPWIVFNEWKKFAKVKPYLKEVVIATHVTLALYNANFVFNALLYAYWFWHVLTSSVSPNSLLLLRLAKKIHSRKNTATFR
ncbi:opsin Rh3-like [Oscarella lobularis]|uniref:opsin Rh3-like n=1 Tax=Oscarella lobularis TaxID=121494 RepID=UPI00331309F4